jgi:hypothetical protein
LNTQQVNRFQLTVGMPARLDQMLMVLLLLLSAPIMAFSGNESQLQERRNTQDNSTYVPGMRLDNRGTPRALYNLCFELSGAIPEEAARAYIDRNAALLGLVDGESSVKLVQVQRVPGGTHVRFSQSYKGIPVHRADIVVTTNDVHQVVLVLNNAKPNISLSSLHPAITEHQAIRVAALAIQKKGRSIGKDDDATLVIYGDEQERYHLAYRVNITTDDPAGDWEIFVDAETGTILHIEDRFVMHTASQGHTGSGYAYVPDPLSASRHRYNDPGFVDGNDADTDSLTRYRSPVQLDSLTYEDGLYKLQGPYCTVTEIEAPYDPPFYGSPTVDGFQYTRSQPGFEAVNVYYHVTTAFRHLLNLGFESPTLRQIRLDPHGFQGQDNSHFSPSGNWISWGTEGVDDAEDATAIWHEYAHAIQYNFVPTWEGGESAALGEGFADYWAASYARSVGRWTPADDQYNWVFGWDGHNPYWLGRIVNDKRTYPFGTLPIHSAGQIWSSTLMGIWGELGREVTDRLVIKSLFYLGSGTTGPDQAQALLQADRDLYGGEHLQTLIYWLGTVKHFLDPAAYEPTIVHVPLLNSPDSRGPFEIRAVVHSAFGIDEQGVKLYWQCNGASIDSLRMVPTVNPDEYSCLVPGLATPGVYAYYITAKDVAGSVVAAPVESPGQVFRFQAGIDSTCPFIEHFFRPRLAVHDSILTLAANVMDNTLIDSVWIEYRIDSAIESISVPLSRSGTSSYGARLVIPEGVVRSGDSLHYRLFARDGSVSHNTSVYPTGGMFSSKLVVASGTVLLVDDGLAGEPTESPSGEAASSGVSLSTSTRLIAQAFQSTDYAMDWMRFADLDTQHLVDYQLVILSGGVNPSPFDDSGSRAALCDYVARGGKVLIEGSEVGRYYRNTDGSIQEKDVRFRTAMLHISTYTGSVDTARLIPLSDAHPLWNSPHRITGPIQIGSPLDQRGFDIITVDPADPSTSLLAGWSGSVASGGIVAHCAESGSTDCSTIYFTFSVATLEDAETADALIRNTVSYMLSHTPVASLVSPEESRQPGNFLLSQNYPNPFNPTTTIAFTLPEQAMVSLKVYNVLGQEITTLVSAVEAPGVHTALWNGTCSSGSEAATGTYFYRFEVTNLNSQRRSVQTRKMHLIR